MQAKTLPLAQRCETLLKDIRSGQAGAWERLLDAFGPLVLSLARGAGLGHADAEDAFQTTWLALHRSIPRIREPGALAAWIASTARREAWRVARRRPQAGPTRGGESILPTLAGGEPGPQETAEQMERILSVQRGLTDLDPRCRQLIEQLFFSPESPRYEDIASAMAMKLGSVGPTRIRCLAKLAAILEQQGWR